MTLPYTTFADTFGAVLDNLVDGETYDKLPPRGPNDSVPSATDKELEAQDEDIYGQSEEEPFVEASDCEKRTRLIETICKKRVDPPTAVDLDGVNILGIVGDNKRILTSSFHLILARAAVVNFRYTRGQEKPYFYTRDRNASSILVLDNNIFDETYSVYTYNAIAGKTNSRLLDELRKNKDNKPIRFRYDFEAKKKTPSAQSLGLAVKLQHTLELDYLSELTFENDGLTVCLKEGAIFSNSTELLDIRDGLKNLLTWDAGKAFFIGMSKQVADSRVLITTLTDHPHLVEDFFPKQNIPPKTIKSFGSDTLLLKKILRPGERTTLVEYIEKTREGAIDQPGLEGLKPVTCYYHKRTKPYSFVRLEMPGFMFEANPELAEKAISIALWQYELGGGDPMVLRASAERSDLTHERSILEQQLNAMFEKKNLGLVEFLDTTG